MTMSDSDPEEQLQPGEEDSEEYGDETELQSSPAQKGDDPNYIPETGLTTEDEEDIFGTGERSDGSIDEMERTDIDDLTGDDDDDFSDVLEVDEEDIMGKEPEPKPRKIRLTRRIVPPPPSTLGGMQY